MILIFFRSNILVHSIPKNIMYGSIYILKLTPPNVFDTGFGNGEMESSA